MQLHLIFQGEADPPQLDIPNPVVDLSDISSMTMCLIEGGMESGDPSVLIAVSDDDGSVVIQTSLDKFLGAAAAFKAGAEARWGWVQEEGHFTLLPPASREARKAMLESIAKELEGWDDGK